MENPIIAVLPFAGALAARLMYRRWEAWLAWIAFAALSCIGISLGPVIAASVVGFIAPELWHALRAWLRQPRTIAILLGVAAVAYAIYVDQRLIGLVLGIGILLVAFRKILGIKPRSRH